MAFHLKVSGAGRAVACGWLLFTVGCASGPRGFPPTLGIQNFDRVDQHLYRGAQPNALSIARLKQLGVRTVLNLRWHTEIWPAEKEVVTRNGLKYESIPIRGFQGPKDQDIAKALQIIQTDPGPVYVHCQYGCERTGAIVACYRIKRYGWPSEQALAEARIYGMSGWALAMKRFVRHFEKMTRPPLRSSWQRAPQPAPAIALLLEPIPKLSF
jgi:protein tyrosine phosphatase (PTP) superfamily phosphohydrolase (DUF442 family)